MLWVAFFIAFGYLVEVLFTFFIVKRMGAGTTNGDLPISIHGLEKFTAAIVKQLPHAIGLLLFWGGAYLAYFSFIWTDSPFVQLFFLAVLISITIIRLITLISNLVFSPTAITFRLLPMQCNLAGGIHRLIVWATIYMVVVLMFSVVIRQLGAQANTVSLLQLFFASVLLGITALFIIRYRHPVKQQIISAAQKYGENATWGRIKFATLWHFFGLTYLFSLWFLLLNDLIDPGQKHRGAFILSFFILPIWLIADKLVQWLIKYAMATLKIHMDHYDDQTSPTEEEIEHREKGKQTFRRVLSFSRSGLVFILMIWLASLWDINIPIFSNLTAVIFDSLIILTLALIFWQFISSWIERKIQESLPEEEDNKEEDDEWGSAAARGRSYTLLPMIRRFIGTVLVTMVTMTILSSTGVDIGPLLAGAGVVGLAVGFGAQKLVADMFSGFFYLLDDAFRVGEYVEAGGISGTVENISLRNVMLRHHRGMLQIVPHSELGAITNYMRGGIVVKFNLDFPYDAEIDKIRKIIKKVGQAMLEDEEFGDDFIRPVKSQGVREITNSVMTIRVKFTAKPGAHFVIRREAYKRITEALRSKGIHYAHRKVIVDIPGQAADNPTDPITQAAGAAGQEIIDAEDKQNYPPAEGQMSFDR